MSVDYTIDLVQSLAEDFTEKAVICPARFLGVRQGICTVDEVKNIGKMLSNPQYCYPVFWKEDIWVNAVSGADSFIGTYLSDNEFGLGVHLWDFEFLQSGDIDGISLDEYFGNDHWGIGGLMIESYKDGIVASLIASHRYEFYHRFITLGHCLYGEACNENMAELVAANRFMQLPFVQIDEARKPRRERRRAEKEGKTLPSVSVINLRRKDADNICSHSSGAREYQCKWIRRGHWRKLPKPRKLDGAENTYVTEALCGPDDKPLKMPTLRIAQVVR